MKNLLLVALAILLFSCNNTQDAEQDKTQNTNNPNENALLYNQVKIRQEINFFPELNKDWKESLVKSDLLKTICNAALNGKDVYDIEEDKKLNKEDVSISLGEMHDTLQVENIETGEFSMQIKTTPIDLNQLKAIYFYENWYMSPDLKSFKKEIDKYSVVRQVVDHESVLMGINTKDTLSFLTFLVKNNNNSKSFEPIAENVISEFYFDDEYANIRIKGLNIENLQSLILDNVLSGKVKTYSFNDLKEEISLDDLKEILGETKDTLQIEDIKTGEFSVEITENHAEPESIIGLIFIENWLYDKETMMIKKEVIGLSPIWQNTRISDAGDVMESKMIPFVIRFNTQKTNN